MIYHWFYWILRRDSAAVNPEKNAALIIILKIIILSFPGGFRNVRLTGTGSRKRRSEGNLETEDSDSEQASTADDQEENGSGDDVKKEDEQGEKVKRTPRKKRRFR